MPEVAAGRQTTLYAAVSRQVNTGKRVAASAAPTPGAKAPTLLVKGSRGSAMDRVAEALLQGATDAA